MDNQLDSENYWNRSNSKGFSFDDDGTDGVADFSGGSKWDSLSILNDDAISETNFDNNATYGTALNLSIKSVIPEESLKLLLQEQTLDERVITKGMSPEEELKLLRRQIQTTIYSPSPEETAIKLLQGNQCHLAAFKSLHEKEQLLDAVFAIGGGDGVIEVLLFLRKTLNSSKFNQILKQRPKAMQHYISYLTQRQCEPQWAEACELLKMFSKHNESTMQEFRMLNQSTSANNTDVSLKQQSLRQLLARYRAGPGVINVYQQIFEKQLKLLEFIAKERNSLDNLVDANSTPIEVLYACCRKHTNWQEQDLIKTISPFRLCAEQQISAAQFEWTALNERATQQAYADLESVFERAPSWNPLKQKQFHISFSLETAVVRLFQLQAPSSVLYLFVSKVGNASDKLALAQKVKCVKGTIDALGGLKNVDELMQLRDRLPERSEEQFYCDKVLKNLQNKRWTTDGLKLKLSQ